MAIEIRRILFEAQTEFQQAIETFLDLGRSHIPAGKVLDMTVTQDDPLVADLVLQTRGGQTERWPLDENHMTAAAIAYCRVCKIPLPRQGTKVVRQTKNGIALDVRIRSTGKK